MAFEILGMSLYLWIALISLLFLIVLVALGGYGFDIDADVDADVDVDYGEFSGPGISPLSLPLVAAFGASFGSIGALLEMADLHPALVAGLAALLAIVIAASLLLFIQRFLVRAQATSEVRPGTLVGRRAQVTIPIRRGSQGQILVITEARGRTLFPAQAEEVVDRDAIVEIIGFEGGVANVRKKHT